MSLLRQGPGVFFLFAAFVLLIFVSVSAPVWHSLAFLKVEYGNVGLRFGNWGYIVRAAGSGWRSPSGTGLGYGADDAVDVIGATGNISGAIVHGLTYALVLHPIAAAVTLLAIVVSLTTNVILDIIGSLIAFFAFLICLVALIIDSVLFVTARHKINDAIPGSPASLSNAYWLVVASTILLLLASVTVCFGSARARRQKRLESSGVGAQPAMYETRPTA